MQSIVLKKLTHNFHEIDPSWVKSPTISIYFGWHEDRGGGWNLNPILAIASSLKSMIWLGIVKVIRLFWGRHFNAWQDGTSVLHQVWRLAALLLQHDCLTLLGSVQDCQFNGVALDVVHIIGTDIAHGFGGSNAGGGGEGLTEGEDKGRHPVDARTDVIPSIAWKKEQKGRWKMTSWEFDLFSVCHTKMNIPWENER